MYKLLEKKIFHLNLKKKKIFLSTLQKKSNKIKILSLKRKLINNRYYRSRFRNFISISKLNELELKKPNNNINSAFKFKNLKNSKKNRLLENYKRKFKLVNDFVVKKQNLIINLKQNPSLKFKLLILNKTNNLKNFDSILNLNSEKNIEILNKQKLLLQ
jgi:hypothetical protein